MEESTRSSAASSGNLVAPQKSSIPLLLGIAVLAVAGGGGSAWFVTQRSRIANASPAESFNAPKHIIRMEGFTVNLADTEETHFLRVTLELGVDRLPEGADREKIASAIPTARIRDSILSVLTACKAEPLLTPEGKAQLKKNLIEALNRNVPELAVRDVYFTEFLVQR